MTKVSKELRAAVVDLYAKRGFEVKRVTMGQDAVSLRATFGEGAGPRGLTTVNMSIWAIKYFCKEYFTNGGKNGNKASKGADGGKKTAGSGRAACKTKSKKRATKRGAVRHRQKRRAVNRNA